MRDEYGAVDERSLRLRFHAQTSGASLTAQQPENNIARVAVEGLAAVLGGAQSLHTDSFDEALALPSDKAARIALRTQQIIAEETGVALVADPLGGSAYVEWMTDELERQAEEVFARLRHAGNGSMLEGVYAGIDDGYFVSEIADAAYRFESGVSSGTRIVVGVNAATDGNDAAPKTLFVGPEVEELQLKRLAAVKARRNTDHVAAALGRITDDAADSTINLVPAFIDAVKADCTLGEISAALEGVFGTYREPALA
jgi:methylmalonyl-CoA mutase N-terminal domain/subunit